MILSKWRHASSVVRGNDHIENDLPCQDNVAYKLSKGIEVIALSDGAGSKPMSQIGSEVATKTICEYMVEEFDNIYFFSEKYGKTKDEIEEQKKIIKENIFNYVKKNLLLQAKGEIEFEELACTLLFFARKGEKYIMGHIGDGVIAGSFSAGKDQQVKVLSAPENGEQINITFFLTDPDAIDHLRITCGKFTNLTGVMLMSDGPEEVLFQGHELHENVTKLFNNFNDFTSEKYNKVINKFLSTQVAQYSYDDLSLNILYLTCVDTNKTSKEVLEDLFSDITEDEQIIRKSKYGYMLDNTKQFKVSVRPGILINNAKDNFSFSYDFSGVKVE